MTKDTLRIDLDLWQALPEAKQLVAGGLGIRFEVEGQQIKLPAFAVKQGDTVYAYLNQCAHVAMEMDWQAGQFFDFDQQYIMCATHGALYEPATGVCVAGPCVGKQLKPLELRQIDGIIYAPRRL